MMVATELEWYVNSFLYPVLMNSMGSFIEEESVKKMMTDVKDCVTLPILGEILQGTIVFQGFGMCKMDLTLQVSKWFHQHHLNLPSGTDSMVNVKVNRQSSPSLLQLLQILYIRNELGCVMEMYQTITIKNCIDVTEKLKSSLKRCLFTLNAYSKESEGKALKISSFITDPQLPAELSLKLYIHHDIVMLECIWTPSDHSRAADKKYTPLILTISLPILKDLHDLHTTLTNLYDLIEHLTHPCKRLV